MISFDGVRGGAIRSLGALVVETPGVGGGHLMDSGSDIIPSAEARVASTSDEKTAKELAFQSQGMGGNWIERLLGVDANYELDRSKPLLPQMFKWNYIGLYAHYAGVGITGGLLAVSTSFCFYYYDGANNVCATAPSLIAIAWGFKIFYGVGTDMWRPCGTRRKMYMIAGWTGVLVMLFILTVGAANIDVHSWIGINLVLQAFLMLADVPADGYCVEIGQLEKPEERGQVLATGQRLRFMCSILAGGIQALLVNGPSTNPPGCAISFESCWEWGLTPNGYYGLMLSILFVLCLPIFFLKEIPAHGPAHTFADHKRDIWETMQNPTTLYLLIFVVGNNMLTGLSAQVISFVLYRLIQLSNFQSGILSVLGGVALVTGIWIFQKFFIHRNWRFTQYLSTILSSALALVWLPVFYNLGGTMNAWFVIFLSFQGVMAAGIAQVLFAMAVIELAKKGQEATTYELIISTANSAGTINSILSVQLLTPMHANVCQDASGTCTKGAGVDIYSMDTYFATGGPDKFTAYTLLIFAINIAGMFIFTQFLPRQKDQCAEWRDQDFSNLPPRTGWCGFFSHCNDIYVSNRTRVGVTSIAIAVTVILYEITTAIALLTPSWSCLPAFGGSGCGDKGR